MKFFGGLLLGTASNISFWETGLVSASGAISMVALIMLVATYSREAITKFLNSLKHYYFNCLLFVSGFILDDKKYYSYKKRLTIKRKPKKFSKTIRIVVKSWMGFGPLGVAFLTPLLLSPIGGALIAVSFRANYKKTMLYMVIFHVFFGLLFAFLLSEFGHLIERVLGISLGVQG